MRPRGKWGPLRWLALLAGLTAAAPAAAAAAQNDPVNASAIVNPLPEIVVTARRRPERLQRTPVSLIALTQEELEARSVTNLRSLQNFAPNLTFAPSQNVGEAAANVFIRGIGQEDFIAGTEMGVGFYLDGVYVARPVGLIANIVDVARIEVLRGPQGTLFGKNTIGGAINLLSVPPQAEPHGRASVILGNYDRAELRTVLNAPLFDKILARLSLGVVSRDGYLSRLPPPAPLDVFEPFDRRAEGSDRSQAARLQVRWLVTDTLTTDVALDASRKRNTQGATHVEALDRQVGLFTQINQLIREGRLPGPQLTDDLLPDDPLESLAANANFADIDGWGASVTIAKQIGADTLKFIGGYREQRSHIGTDSDGLYFTIIQSEFRDRQHQYSGEAQLTGTRGGLDYTAGLFAFVERARSLPARGVVLNAILYTCGCFAGVGRLPEPVNGARQLRGDNYAAYAQGTYRITGPLSVTLGGRYSHERKSVEARVFQLGPDLEQTNIVAGQGGSRDEWNSFTWRAGVEYQASTDLMVYGSIAEGFKSGGFNVRPNPRLPNLGLTSFEPETALTFEIGGRSEWLDRKLRLNATIFQTNYEDIQLRQQTQVGGMLTTLIENAAEARIRGVEVEVTAAPLQALMLSAAYGHLSARYLDVGKVPNITLDSRLQRTPSHSFTASADYRASIGPGQIELHADFSYRSKEQFQITASPFDQPGYGLVGARATYRSADERWSLALFGSNLTDERYRAAGRGAVTIIGMPRQVGIQLAHRF